MQIVGDLLNAAFESLDPLAASTSASNPAANGRPTRPLALIGRGAYLQIMGEVFEALNGLSQAVPLDDLKTLSKIIAEQRKAESEARKAERAARNGTTTQPRSTDHRKSKTRDAAGTDTDPDGLDGFTTRRLPARFGEIVRQIYGTSFADDVRPGTQAVEATELTQ